MDIKRRRGLRLPSGKFRRRTLLVFYSVALFALGAICYRSGWITNIMEEIRYHRDYGIDRLVAAYYADPETIYLDINFENLEQIRSKRRAAIARNLLLSSREDFVPAKIRYRERTIPARLRLKGDLSDHWAGEKWSFRIVTKGQETLFGLKRFSIQHPATRDFLHEWFFHQVLKKEGVIALRYDFINVVINGKPMGIYALEEHFDKRLIENNDRREGPIVRFNENFNIMEVVPDPRSGSDPVLSGSGAFDASEVDGFGESRWTETPERRAQYAKAVNLLAAFRGGTLTASQVFDVALMARFLALTEIMGAAHSVFWRNIRFYHNPVSDRLEPIGFDAGTQDWPRKSLLVSYGKAFNARPDDVYYYDFRWFDSLFADQALYEAYVSELERLTKDGYVDDLLADLDEEIQQKLHIICSEFPDFNFDSELYRTNQNFVRAVLNPVKVAHAYFVGVHDNKLQLRIGNLQYLPVEIDSVLHGERKIAELQEASTIIPGRNPAHLVSYGLVEIPLTPNVSWTPESAQLLDLRIRIRGASQSQRVRVTPWPYAWPEKFDRDPMRALANAIEFDFLDVDRQNKEIRIKPGRWTVDRDVVIPSGWTLLAGLGVELLLTGNAKIVSRSPIRFIGSEEHPIRVSGGQGLVVIGAGGPSKVEHVVFEELGYAHELGWSLTGAVTFYESPVALRHVSFRRNTAEDSLNLIRSSFELDRCLFEDATSDALDIDFGQGTITDSSFLRSTNDAIDVSGTSVTVERVFIDTAGDKAISAGEASRVSGADIRIVGTRIGIASKDLSEFYARDVSLHSCEVGLAAYRKKSEFGPGRLEVDGLELQDIRIPYLKEPDSRLRIDRRWIEESQANAVKLLYPNETANGK